MARIILIIHLSARWPLLPQSSPSARASRLFPLRLSGRGYFLVEYYEPGVLTVPLLPFIVGGVIGSLIIGIFTEWALMVVSCLIGAYYVTNLFTLSPTAEILVGSGLFIIGALTQVSSYADAGSDSRTLDLPYDPRDVGYRRPLEPVRQMVQKLFTNVRYYVVEDDHRLHKSVHELDWNSILE